MSRARDITQIMPAQNQKEVTAAGIGISVVLDGEAWLDQRLFAPPILGEPIAGGVYAAALRKSLDLPAFRAFVGLREDAANLAAH